MDLSDDVWLEIFELIPPRQLATNILPTCTRFQNLAIRTCLRHLIWLTPPQITASLDFWAWDPRFSLPKSLWIGPVIDARNRAVGAIAGLDHNAASPLSLYHRMNAQISQFHFLNTLTISELRFSENTYLVLQTLPHLRDLAIINCQYYAPEHQPHTPPVVLHPLSIKHLHLHNLLHKEFHHRWHTVGSSHPLHLLTSPNLTTLAITWTLAAATAYQDHVHDPFNQNLPIPHFHAATPTHPRASASLNSIEIYIPKLELRFFEGLISLTSPSVFNPALRVKVQVYNNRLDREGVASLAAALANRHNFPDQPHHQNQPSLYGRVGNVWCYTGPIEALDIFSAPKKILVDKFGRKLSTELAAAIEDSIVPLTHLRLRPPAVDANTVVRRLEKLRKPLLLEQLEVCLECFDQEIFFAISELCPNIRRLVVRFGSRGWNVNESFVIKLGSSILPSLPHLRTLRILHDSACRTTAAKISASDIISNHVQDPLTPTERAKSRIAAQRLSKTLAGGNTDTYLEDYLTAWKRFYPQLNRVQIVGAGTAWVRRGSELSSWRKVWVEDSQKGDFSDFRFDNGDDEECEFWLDSNSVLELAK